MENIIIIAVVGLLLAIAAGYVIKEKKSGKKCIGCPCSSSCKGMCGSFNSENTEDTKNGKDNNEG